MRCSKRERCTKRSTLHRALPGTRPGVLLDPGPPWVEAVTAGYVDAGVPLLGAPSLADSSAEAIDGSTLSFLLQRALDEKRKEEEVREAKEVEELMYVVARKEDRLVELVEALPPEAKDQLTKLERAVVSWYMSTREVRKRKGKRKRRKRLRRRVRSWPSCSS